MPAVQHRRRGGGGAVAALGHASSITCRVNSPSASRSSCMMVKWFAPGHRDQHARRMRGRAHRVQIAAVGHQRRQLRRAIGDRQRLVAPPADAAATASRSRHRSAAASRSDRCRGAAQARTCRRSPGRRRRSDDRGTSPSDARRPTSPTARSVRRCRAPAPCSASQSSAARISATISVERRVGCQRVARQRRRPATRIRTGDQVGELVLAVALPVAAMDEHQARRLRIRRRKQIPRVALARSVAQIEMLRHARRETPPTPPRHAASSAALSVTAAGLL